MTKLEEFHQAFRQAANPTQAKILQRFFKTGPGQYGAGDRFLGLKVPQTRQIVQQFADVLTFADLEKILHSPYHEERLAAFAILVVWFRQAYKTADEAKQKMIYQFYLAQSHLANNWDLVDSSAPTIVGIYLLNHPSELTILEKYAHSTNLWQQRIAMLATFPFIKAAQLEVALTVAELLLNHPHDLMHKAVGWMLREVGKVDQPTLEVFLQQHYSSLSRTTLRYAIERFPVEKRRQYLRGQFTP